jgi:hypothetical protein
MSASSLIQPPVERRVDESLGQMPLDEKVGQTNQLNSFDELRHAMLRHHVWAGPNSAAGLQGEFELA